MRFILLALLPAVMFFTACNNSSKPATANNAAPAAPATATLTPESDLTKDQTAALMNVVSTYYSLKDALVAADGNKADEAASKLLSAAELFNHDVAGQPQHTEMQPQLQKIMAACDVINNPRTSDIEAKRQQFSTISDAMFQVLKKAGLRHGGVYQEFCPMAFNDKGAYWLSAESEIKNPYFGKKMLECGEVRDSL
jgi:Cu(I)/Ag(I) efflux system membrane fusion protein